MRHPWLLLVLLALLTTAGPLNAQEGTTVTLIAHDSFAYSETIWESFTAETGIQVEVLRLGDAGLLTNQAVLNRENPLGDVIFGIDNTFLGRALEADIFIPYESPELANVSPEFQLDPEMRVTPVDYGDVCLNYDAAYFSDNALDIPESLIDLTQPEYRGLLTVQNPASSSPGLAFLLTTVAVFGETSDYTYLDFWADLLANDVYISNDWTDAYYNQFSGSAGSIGTRPLVVSYASSPPAEVFFADPQPETAPTGAITAPGTCFRQVEFAGILRGTEHQSEAEQVIDFLLSRTFQEDMPLNMFVFPVHQEAELPEVFAEFAEIPEEPVMLDIATIQSSRESWIEAWTRLITR